MQEFHGEGKGVVWYVDVSAFVRGWCGGEDLSYSSERLRWECKVNGLVCCR